MTLKQLNDLERTAAREKHPTIPERLLVSRTHTDRTANGLTKAIQRWAELMGYQAKRVNVMGIPVDNRQVVTDYLGMKRQIGSVQYRPSGSTKGAADISIIAQGRAIECEIKVGNDRQSPAQREYQVKVERAGGVYLIAHTFEQFTEEITKYLKP